MATGASETTDPRLGRPIACAQDGCNGSAAVLGRCVFHAEDADVIEAIKARGVLDLRGTRVPANYLMGILGWLREADGLARIDVLAVDRAVIAGDLTLEQLRVERYVSAARADFHGNLTLDGCEFKGAVAFARVRIAGAMKIRNSRSAGDLSLQEMRATHVAFHESTVGGALSFRGAEVGGRADLREITCGSLHAEGAIVRGEMWLHRARVDGDVQLMRVLVERAANLRGARIGGTLRIDRATLRSTLDLGHVAVAGALWLEHSNVDGGLDMRQARIERSLRGRAVRVDGPVHLTEASFGGTLWLQQAHFAAAADARQIEVERELRLEQARFGSTLHLDGATFRGALRLDGAHVEDLSFANAVFEWTQRWTRVTAAGTVSLVRAQFSEGLDADVDCDVLDCSHATFATESSITVDRGEIVLDGSVFRLPSVLSGAERSGSPELPRVRSMRYADVGQLVLANLDLRTCAFTGAHNLDRLRLEGTVSLTRTPRGLKAGWALPPVWRWTRRDTVLEEHAWRSRTAKRRGWTSPPQLPADDVHAADVAVLYRSLRKGREDQRDAPGSADFYYGEMEMRRKSGTPADRLLLTGYWMLSGYGLRASRAFAALVVVIAVFAMLFQTYGFKDVSDPFRAEAPGQTTAIEQPPVRRLPTTPSQLADALGSVEAWTYSAATASSLTVGPDARLRPAGRTFRLILRIVGPLLIALVLLAIRSRVKR